MSFFIPPYVLAHQEYAALLGHVSDPNPRLDNSEYGQFVVESEGRLLWQSKVFDLTQIAHQDSRIQVFWRRRAELRHYIVYTKYRHGYPYVVRLRLPHPPVLPLPNGKTVVTINPRSPAYPATVRRARDSVGRSVKLRPPARSPRDSSPLRPSPETFVVAFTKVSETNRNAFTGQAGNVVTTVTPSSRLYWQRTWTGVRTPNFSRLKPRQYPVNPHTVKIKEVATDMSMRYNFSPITGVFDLVITPWTAIMVEPSDPVHLPLARNKALRSLIDKAELGINNVAQDIVQISQTTNLIAHNARKIASAVNNLRKGNIPRAISDLTAGRSRSPIRKGRPSPSKDLAENWLELQYGWKPLLADIEGVMKSLSILNQGDPSVQTATSSASAYDWRETSSDDPSEISCMPFGVVKTKIRTRTSCKFTLRYRIASPLKSFLAQTGFTNPVNLVWEVIPFSFVVDWFLPIGPYLESLSAWDGLQFLDGSQTLFTTNWTHSTVDYEGACRSDGTGQWTKHARFSKNVTLLDRTKLTAFPTLTLPEFKNPFPGVDHALNALALLRAAFK